MPGVRPRVLGRVARPADARVGGRVAVGIELENPGGTQGVCLPRVTAARADGCERLPSRLSLPPLAFRLSPRPYLTGTFAFSSSNQFWTRLMRVISVEGRRLILVRRNRRPSRSRS